MTIAASPYLPEIDAHLWRGLRKIEGEIKLGVMMRRTDRAPQWVARLLNLLMAERAIKLDVVYQLKGVKEPAHHYHPLFRLLQRTSEASASPLAAAPIIVKPACCFVEIAYEGAAGLAESAREKIKQRQLDVLLWLDQSPLQGDSSCLARLDAWSFRLGDPVAPLLDPPYWREVVDRDPVSHIALLRHPDRFESGQVIASHQAPTQLEWRFTLNAEQPTRMAPLLLIRSVLDVLSAREPAPAAVVKCTQAGGSTLADTARFIKARMQNSLAVRRQRGVQQKWRTYIRAKRRGESSKFTGDGFIQIPKPAGGEYADPFVIENGGRNFVFFEEVPQGLTKGRISALEIFSEREFGPPFTILERSHHLSYPVVFQHGGEIFLLPESAEDRLVPLYRARRFPNEWDHVSNLVEGIPATDTTPFELDGVWYFFTSTQEPGVETLLFYSERLDGNWKYHCANPICSDARRARGAGSLFYREGKLIRPSQDCSVRYGYAIVLNEVTRLSKSEYEERPIETILPDWQPGLIGTHTLNSNAFYEVVDGLRLEKRK